MSRYWPKMYLVGLLVILGITLQMVAGEGDDDIQHADSNESLDPSIPMVSAIGGRGPVICIQDCVHKRGSCACELEPVKVAVGDGYKEKKYDAKNECGIASTTEQAPIIEA